MIGTIVDMQVLEDLIQFHQPKIHQHITRWIGSVTVAVVPWFMCMFIHTLPWEAALRAIDLILSIGSRAIFIISLSIFHTCKNDILSKKGETLLSYIKNKLTSNINIATLFNYAKYYQGKVSQQSILRLRKKHKPDTVDKLPDDIDVVSKPGKLKKKRYEYKTTKNIDPEILRENLKKFDELLLSLEDNSNSSNIKRDNDTNESYNALVSSGPSLTLRGRQRSSTRTSNPNTPDLRDSLTRVTPPAIKSPDSPTRAGSQIIRPKRERKKKLLGKTITGKSNLRNSMTARQNSLMSIKEFLHPKETKKENEQ